MPSGESQRFWYGGLPTDYIPNVNDPGTQKFWINGQPLDLFAISTVIVSGVGLAEGAGTASAVGVMLGNQGAGLATAGATVTGVGVSIATATGTVTAGATVTGVGRSTVQAAGASSGVSSVTAVGVRRLVAIRVGGFTFTELTASTASFLARRESPVHIEHQLNDAPDSCSYRSHVPVQTGELISVDFGDGAGVHFQGHIVRYDITYDDNQFENVIYGTSVTDFTWMLNKRRPIVCYELISATLVVGDLIQRVAPSFTVTGVQADLPQITVQFDGSKSTSECLSEICQLIGGGWWHLNGKDVVLRLTIDPLEEVPDPIDDLNTSLIRDTPISMSEDITQLRNRVFGRGAGVVVTADAPQGSTSIWVEGADLFTKGGEGGLRASLGGGEMNDGCQVFSYAGAEVVPVPTPRGEAPVSPTITPLEVSGAVKKDVKYKISIVRFQSGESNFTAEIVPPSYRGYITRPAAWTGNPYEGGFCTGKMSPGTYRYLLGWRMDDGSMVFDVSYANAWRELTVYAESSSVVFPAGAVPTLASSFAHPTTTPDPRVVGKVIFRTKPGNVNVYYYVEDAPLADNFYVDHHSLDVLGPIALEDYPGFTSGGIMNGVSRSGIKYRLSGFPIPEDRQGIKIYRAERENPPGTGDWSEYRLLVTIGDQLTTQFDDNAATTQEGDLPLAPEPTMRMRIWGIPPSGPRSLNYKVKQGTTLSIWAMEEDVVAQAELAHREGGDGVHEYEVPGLTGITKVEDLRRRLLAELVLYARPVKTVSYPTRDKKSKPGRNVSINLTHPPIGPLSLKIQTVGVDQLHEADGLVERYSVTATTAKLTLEDVLRRLVLSGR